MRKNGPFLTVLILLLVLALAVPALAAKGGNNGNPNGKGGGQGGGGNTPPAAMSVAPNPVSAFGATFTVTGDGFRPNSWVHMTEASPFCCAAYNVMADANGSISYTRITGYPGTYAIAARQLDGKKYKLMASVDFPVVGD